MQTKRLKHLHRFVAASLALCLSLPMSLLHCAPAYALRETQEGLAESEEISAALAGLEEEGARGDPNLRFQRRGAIGPQEWFSNVINVIEVPDSQTPLEKLKTLRFVLRNLIRLQRGPILLEGDKSSAELELLSSEEELDQVAQGLRQYWSGRKLDDSLGRLNQHLALLDSVDVPGAIFRKVHSRVVRLASGGSFDDRLLGWWTNGVALAMHLRSIGLHFETEDGNTVAFDNEFLAQDVRRLIPLFLAWPKEQQERLPSPTPGYHGPNPSFTYRDLMLWGLTVMLDPRVHDSTILFRPPGSRSEDMDYPKLLAQRRWSKGPTQAISEHLLKMLTNLDEVDEHGQPTGRKIPDERVDDLLVNLLTIRTEEWIAKGFRSPWNVSVFDFVDTDDPAPSYGKRIGLGGFIGAILRKVPERPFRDPVFMAVLPDTVLTQQGFPWIQSYHRSAEVIRKSPHGGQAFREALLAAPELRQAFPRLTAHLLESDAGVTSAGLEETEIQRYLNEHPKDEGALLRSALYELQLDKEVWETFLKSLEPKFLSRAGRFPGRARKKLDHRLLLLRQLPHEKTIAQMAQAIGAKETSLDVSLHEIFAILKEEPMVLDRVGLLLERRKRILGQGAWDKESRDATVSLLQRIFRTRPHLQDEVERTFPLVRWPIRRLLGRPLEARRVPVEETWRRVAAYLTQRESVYRGDFDQELPILLLHPVLHPLYRKELSTRRKRWRGLTGIENGFWELFRDRAFLESLERMKRAVYPAAQAASVGTDRGLSFEEIQQRMEPLRKRVAGVPEESRINSIEKALRVLQRPPAKNAGPSRRDEAALLLHDRWDRLKLPHLLFVAGVLAERKDALLVRFLLADLLSKRLSLVEREGMFDKPDADLRSSLWNLLHRVALARRRAPEPSSARNSLALEIDRLLQEILQNFKQHLARKTRILLEESSEGTATPLAGLEEAKGLRQTRGVGEGDRPSPLLGGSSGMEPGFRPEQVGASQPVGLEEEGWRRVELETLHSEEWLDRTWSTRDTQWLWSRKLLEAGFTTLGDVYRWDPAVRKIPGVGEMAVRWLQFIFQEEHGIRWPKSAELPPPTLEKPTASASLSGVFSKEREPTDWRKIQVESIFLDSGDFDKASQTRWRGALGRAGFETLGEIYEWNPKEPTGTGEGRGIGANAILWLHQIFQKHGVLWPPRRIPPPTPALASISSGAQRRTGKPPSVAVQGVQPIPERGSDEAFRHALLRVFQEEDEVNKAIDALLKRGAKSRGAEIVAEAQSVIEIAKMRDGTYVGRTGQMNAFLLLADLMLEVPEAAQALIRSMATASSNGWVASSARTAVNEVLGEEDEEERHASNLDPMVTAVLLAEAIPNDKLLFPIRRSFARLVASQPEGRKKLQALLKTKDLSATSQRVIQQALAGPSTPSGKSLRAGLEESKRVVVWTIQGVPQVRVDEAIRAFRDGARNGRPKIFLRDVKYVYNMEQVHSELKRAPDALLLIGVDGAESEKLLKSLATPVGIVKYPLDGRSSSFKTTLADTLTDLLSRTGLEEGRAILVTPEVARSEFSEKADSAFTHSRML